MNPTAVRVDDAVTSESPTQLGLDQVATELVLRHGETMMLDAIEFSATREDAEDAYQRSLEILLTKAPSNDPQQLVPWLRIVVRNEALQLARKKSRQQARSAPQEALDQIANESATPEDLAEMLHEVEIGFDALRRLNSDQMRCMLAHAEGFDYNEIAASTGFSRRKVSRCLERGRLKFSKHLESISSGSDCERLQPLIDRVISGDADAAIELRPHLRHCISCRRRLSAARLASGRMALLLPPTLVFEQHDPPSWLEQLMQPVSALLHRASTHLPAVERWNDLTPARQGTALLATAALLVGGGVAANRVADRATTTGGEQSRALESVPVQGEIVGSIVTEERGSTITHKKKKRVRRQQKRRSTPTASSNVGSNAPASPQPPAAPAPARSSPAGADDGSLEFAP